jgi:pimeloyl-ACP methyl ester carboxylesterase
MWRRLVGPLATDHRVLVPDLRGFGRSSSGPGDYRKHALAADILALLDAEQIETASIVGHDWGGWIAWLLALEHPDRVERFAALDIPRPGEHDRGLRKVMRQLVFGTYQYVIASPFLGERLVANPAIVRAFIRAGSGPAAQWNQADLDSYARSVSEPARARASVELYRSFLTKEVPRIARGEYTAAELQVPGLAVMGGRSGITKALGLPRPDPLLQVEVIPEAGHFLVDEAPDRVLALLQRFFA